MDEAGGKLGTRMLMQSGEQALNGNQASTFGTRPQHALDLAGLNQTALAKAMTARGCELSNRAISTYTLGSRRRPREINVKAMADILGVNPAWLYSGEGEPRPGVPSGSVSLRFLAEQQERILAELAEIRALLKQALRS